MAFFQRRIEIVGDVEKALKLTFLFDQFLKEMPYQPAPDWQVLYATPM